MRSLRRLIQDVLGSRCEKNATILITRTEVISSSAALGLLGAGSLVFPGKNSLVARTRNVREEGSAAKPLTPPAHGSIPVAFLVSEGAVMIDFAGPWEVFQDTVLPNRSEPPLVSTQLARRTRRYTPAAA